MLRDTLQLLWQGILLAAHQNGARFTAFVLGGVAAAIICFFLCSWFSRLFNRQIQFTLGHYTWCAFAALVTIFLSVALAGVLRLGDVARIHVDQWSSFLTENEPMSRMWDAQYHALVAAGFPQAEYKPYGQHGFLHTPDPKSQEVFTRATSALAMEFFAQKNPLLHHLIKSEDDTAVRAAVEEMQAYFKANTNNVPHNMGNTVATLSQEINKGFSRSIPGFQREAIIVAIIIVVLAQAIPIFLAGLSAYQQISVGGNASGRGSTPRRPPPRRQPASRGDRRRR